jgi:hypothetical protein
MGKLRNVLDWTYCVNHKPCLLLVWGKPGPAWIMMGCMEEKCHMLGRLVCSVGGVVLDPWLVGEKGWCRL